MNKTIKLTTVGEMLKEEFIIPFKLTQNAFVVTRVVRFSFFNVLFL